MKLPLKRIIIVIVMVSVLALVGIGVALTKLTVRDKVPVDRVFRTMVLSAAYEHYDNPFERMALWLGKSRIVSAEYLSAEIESFTLFRIPLGCLRGECRARLLVSLTTTGGYSVVDWSTTSCTNKSLAKVPLSSIPSESKRSVAVMPPQSKPVEYVPKSPGQFFDPDTKVSFEYPKNWKILIEEQDEIGFRISFADSSGKVFGSFSSFPRDIGIETVDTIKSVNITARDGSIVNEEVFRFCDEWKNGSECLKNSGQMIVWAHWHDGLLSFAPGSPEGSEEEKRLLKDFESILPTLNMKNDEKNISNKTY